MAGTVPMYVYRNVTEPVPLSLGNHTPLAWSAQRDEPPLDRTADTPVGYLVLDLTPVDPDPIVPGSVQFSLGGERYLDRSGVLYKAIDPLTGAGQAAGTVNYATGEARITAATAAPATTVTLEALLTRYVAAPTSQVFGRVPAAPLKPSVTQVRAGTVDGRTLEAVADGNGALTASEIEGRVDVQTGIYRLRFGRWVTAAEHTDAPWYDPDLVDAEGLIWAPTPVDPSTVKLTTVGYSYIPLSADLLGLDPVRLPGDGRVPVFRIGDMVVVHHTDTLTAAAPAAGQTLDLGRVRVARARVLDAAGQRLPGDRYSLDRDAGVLTWADPLDLAGYTLPLSVEHTVEDAALLTDAQIDGALTLNRPLSHVYPAGEARVSSALNVPGDLAARASVFWSQQTWTNEWADSRIGAATTSRYNDTLYPPVVTNRGAAQERWAIIFTSATAFRLVGETVGQIAIGDIMTLLAPINPATGTPYFSLRPEGWGSGWAAGNVIRLNTYAANYPLWIVRTVQQGQATADADRFRLVIRGAVNR